MSVEKFRHLFERFQNLNLLVLIEDLRQNRVAVGDWLTHPDYRMCPLYHCWLKYSGHALANKPELETASRLCTSMEKVREFTCWWDNSKGARHYRSVLLAMLEDILAERQEDADAVQEVCHEDRGLDRLGAGLHGRPSGVRGLADRQDAMAFV